MRLCTNAKQDAREFIGIDRKRELGELCCRPAAQTRPWHRFKTPIATTIEIKKMASLKLDF
jgi:hypothetical protein